MLLRFLRECSQKFRSETRSHPAQIHYPHFNLGRGTYAVGAILLALSLGTPASAAGFPAQPSSTSATVPGTIAYINQDNTELRLVQPDGSSDRLLWAAPMVGGVQSGVRYPAWRPDGTEVAFVSDMEQAESLLQSDVFAIRPDGSSLRKVTDTPLHNKLGNFQVGTVKVQVANVNSTASLFIIYVEGAQAAQTTTVPAGTSKTLTFQNVAIFPGESQFPVAINGITRWFGQPDTTTFQPGATNTASITINGSGYDDFGAFNAAWRSDSAEVDFNISQGCVANGIAADPPAGAEWGNTLVPFSASMCPMDRGPTQALSNQILYWDYLGNFPDGAFMQAAEDGAQPTMLFDTGYGNFVYGLKWLPDGSGFLYSLSDGSCYCSNIYKYSFSTQQSTPLTSFTQYYTGKISVSPDGGKVIFERFDVDPNPTLNPDAVPDLWMMNQDGSGEGLFIQNARDPSWGLEKTPPIFLKFLYLPLVDK